MRKLMIEAPGGLNNLVLSQMDAAPAPGTGQVRMRVHASSLNFHDYFVCKTPDRSPDGRIPLADGAGEVLETGSDVTEFKPGDHVVSCFFPYWAYDGEMPSSNEYVPGDGLDGYAQTEVTVPAFWLTKSPLGWTHAEAATIPTAAVTAWRALVVNGGLKAGDTVLTLGSGGVSIFALQLAKAMGARVIATSSSGEKLNQLKALGADETINYRETPEWGMVARELTGGRGVDHVIETGGSGTLPQSINAARVGGHIAVIGVLSGFSGEVPTVTMMLRQQRIQGLMVGSRRDQKDLIAALESTGIRPVLDQSFDLSKLREAFEYQASGAHFGKISITI